MSDLIQIIQSKWSYIETFIFDFDGTIASLAIDWPSARSEFREYLNFCFPALGMSDELRVDEMEAVALKHYPESKNQIFDFRLALETQSMQDLVPVEVTCELIQWIKRETNSTLLILSNNLHETVARSLKQLGLDSSFSLIAGVDDVGVPKPSPEGMSFLETIAPIDRSLCLMIGDNERTDGGFSKNVGISFLNITQYADQ